MNGATNAFCAVLPPMSVGIVTMPSVPMFAMSSFVPRAVDGTALEFTYRNGGFSRRARVEVAPPADTVDGDDLVWELDLAVDTALAHGALGARMTGGGFGGSAIALIPAAEEPAVRAAVVGAFAAAGFTAPDIFAVSPAQGALRVL